MTEDRPNGAELEEIRPNPPTPSRRYKVGARVAEGTVPRTIVLLALVLVVLAGPVSGIAGSTAGHAGPADNGTVTPGEHLSGTLSVQEESTTRDLSRRTLAFRVEVTGGDDERASALATECDRLHQRFRSLRDRARRLEEGLENGSLDRGEFRVRMTDLEAEATTVVDLAEECSRLGERLPPEVRNATGVDVSTYREVGSVTDSFSRRELADHTVVVVEDDSSGTPTARGGLDDDSARNASAEQREALVEAEAELRILEHRLDGARTYVNETDPDDEAATAALTCADDAIDRSRAALDGARQAADDGDDEGFEERMATARERMDTAESCIETAIEEVGP